MSQYPNILTPPSSSEDSPQSGFYNSPPSSVEGYLLPQTSQAFDFDKSDGPMAPYLKIIEQPLTRFRFRYKSEMTGTHGSLCGMNSDRSRKQTYPTIELCNYDKRAIVRCSIYQVNVKDDHRPHAHRLIKKHGKGEVDDPHDGLVSREEGYVHTFHSMGIIHTAKKNIVPELVKKKSQLKREEIARTERRNRELSIKEELEIKGLAEAESKSINLNVVCLRFDAFYSVNGIFYPICHPVYSHHINNLKSALTGELKIVRMDHCTSPASGGQEVFILVERVTKKNIRIKFFELDDEDNLIWEDYGRFSDLDVHHQYAIVFKTPPYRDPGIKNPVKVYMELERPSDGARSEARSFSYVPRKKSYQAGAKRARPNYGSSSFESDELPVTINNLNIGSTAMEEGGGNIHVTSAELQQALTNINSDEFNRIFEQFRDGYELFTTDAPNQTSRRVFNGHKLTVAQPAQRVCSVDEIHQAKQAVLDLQNFVKTKPGVEAAASMLQHYLKHENRTNPLHVSIRQNETNDVIFLLKMIYVWKQFGLVNVRNEYFETPLHIAVLQNHDEIVSNLIVCKADPALEDLDMNTALHLAVLSNGSITVFEKIFAAETFDKRLINAENCDGNTAVNLAIETENLKALKMLCQNGAEINHRHKKDGYTPFRFALEKQNLEFVRYMLQHNDLDPAIEDFRGVNPLQAGLSSGNKEIVQLITDFMKSNNYMEDIKQEAPDLVEASDEEVEEKYSANLKNFSPAEMKEFYAKIHNLTPIVMDQICMILDRSGTWLHLAELLDLGHLIRSGYFDTSGGSPTRKLLKVSIETNGDTVYEIRNFLENLDESQAVDLIDDMVRALQAV